MMVAVCEIRTADNEHVTIMLCTKVVDANAATAHRHHIIAAERVLAEPMHSVTHAVKVEQTHRPGHHRRVIIGESTSVKDVRPPIDRENRP
jgi:hypothetical protein